MKAHVYKRYRSYLGLKQPPPPLALGESLVRQAARWLDAQNSGKR